MKNAFLVLCLAAIIVGIYGLLGGPDPRRVEGVNTALRQLQTALAAVVPDPSPAPSPTPLLPGYHRLNPPASPSPALTSRSANLSATTVAPELLNGIVTITGPEGAGTGFVCRFQGKEYVATNQHVLGVGTPLTIRTARGAPLSGRSIIAAAADADIALIECAAYPPDLTPLEITTLPDPAVRQDDPVTVLGNSKGDGVITQTPGKLLALGPQRIEVDNPIYHGNSGSPIVHVATRRVIGVLTEAETLTLHGIDKASFGSQNSALKSTVRYFGHRLDSVQRWEPLNWGVFQDTETALRQSREELDALYAYFSDKPPADNRFPALSGARSEAAEIYSNHRVSGADRSEAYARYLRTAENLVRNARSRLANRKVYYSQRQGVDTVNEMADAALVEIASLQRDDHLAGAVLGSAK